MIQDLSHLFECTPPFRLLAIPLNASLEEHWSDRVKGATIPDFKLEIRKWEWLGTRVILESVFPGARLSKTEFGKPELDNGFQISISHDRDLLVVALSSNTIGVDIQSVDDRVWRIKERFLIEEEKHWVEASHDPHAYATMIWASKEAVFKYFGTDVDFAHDCMVHPVQQASIIPLTYEGRHGKFHFALQHISYSNRHIVVANSANLHAGKS